MAIDPRLFTVKSGCAKEEKRLTNEDEKRRSFLSELRKVGDLEILNDIGFGKVGEGLRTLAKLSDSARLGKTINIGSDATGENFVLEQVGISRNAIDKLAQLKPEVANRALGQAKAIYDKLKTGNFNAQDIPDVFQDLQNAFVLSTGIYTPSPEETSKGKEICQFSNYASDLIRFAPKYKFLFIVQFNFNAAYSAKMKQTATNFAFVVKTSTRPNVSFEYEEVNLYNFWTRIPKRTVYQPMTMRFYDDNLNNAMQFYTAYLKAMSPIANIENGTLFEQQSMNFKELRKAITDPNGLETHKYAASLGPLLDNNKTILESIDLFHIYQYGARMNSFKFINPKITDFEFNELDMAENGEGADLSLNFAYDSVYIETNRSIEEEIEFVKNISGRNAGALNYIDPIFDQGATDILKDENATIQQVISETPTLVSNAFTQNNPFPSTFV